jgi:hypothetical protein
MRSSTDFWAFLRAFGERWFLLMCGPLTVPFAIAALFVKSENYKVLFGILALLCLGFSSYWIWRAERKKRIKTKRLLGDKVAALNRQIAGLSAAAQPDDPKAKSARRRQLREQLGEFLATADYIRMGAVTLRSGYNNELTQWLKKVRDFLAEEPEFDSSHLARFNMYQAEAVKEFIQEFKG